MRRGRNPWLDDARPLGTVKAALKLPAARRHEVTLLAINGRAYGYLRTMIGKLGWLDTPAPPPTYVPLCVAAARVMLGLNLAIWVRLEPPMAVGSR
jgi:hypothetical protein